MMSVVLITPQVPTSHARCDITSAAEIHYISNVDMHAVVSTDETKMQCCATSVWVCISSRDGLVQKVGAIS